MIFLLFAINQLANAQTCPNGKILVCGCEHGRLSHYVCKCVNENTAGNWLSNHPCGTGFLAASIENAPNQIFSLNADSNFNWQISSSDTPINNLSQNERLKAIVYGYREKLFGNSCQIKWRNQGNEVESEVVCK